MEERKIITSTQNSLVKQVAQLKEKSRLRKKTGQFVIEGKRELELAVAGGYALETLFICEGIIGDGFSQTLPVAAETILISKSVYEKLAHRGGTEGILALAKAKSHALEDIMLTTENPLILVAEAPEKPGNIGALLRTADAANIDAVIIANPKGDLYNPNIIRSSVGCVFTNTIALGTTEGVISFLNDKGIGIFCASLSASKNYVEATLTGPTAIVVGTEATGLSSAWLSNSQENLIIPMQGHIDSMNVSVSAAILIFEAKRQRGF